MFMGSYFAVNSKSSSSRSRLTATPLPAMLPTAAASLSNSIFMTAVFGSFFTSMAGTVFVVVVNLMTGFGIVTTCCLDTIECARLGPLGLETDLTTVFTLRPSSADFVIFFG